MSRTRRQAADPLDQVEDDPGEDRDCRKERPVEAEPDELGPDQRERVADVVSLAVRVSRRVAGRRRVGLGLAIAQGTRKRHLEPDEGSEDEEEEERRPAEVDARESSVRRPEALVRPTDPLQDESDESDEQGGEPLQPPLVSS